MHEQGSFAASIICSSAKLLATGIVERHLLRNPQQVRSYGTGDAALTLDTEVRLGYLAEALATDRPALFVEQMRWVKVLSHARDVSSDALRTNFECMAEELQDRLPEESARRASEMIGMAAKLVDQSPDELPSYLEGHDAYMQLARMFLLAVLEGREHDAVKVVLDEFENGAPIADLYEHVLNRVQREMGRMWQMGEVTIAEEHYCTGIVTTIMTVMRAKAPRPEPIGRRVITAAVSNETHALGILLVTQAFEAKGWSAISLGANTPANAIAEAVRDFGGDVIALSANMVLYVRQTAELIAELRAHPDSKDVPILVGGQPFNLVDDLWEVVGADGTAPTAVDSPEVAERLLESR